MLVPAFVREFTVATCNDAPLPYLRLRLGTAYTLDLKPTFDSDRAQSGPKRGRILQPNQKSRLILDRLCRVEGFGF